MKMTTRTAAANMKYNKNRNLLIGLAICLTTLLLLLVPSVMAFIVRAEHAAVNKVYPTWHGVFRSVDIKTAEQLKARAELGEIGLRVDVGRLEYEDYELPLVFIDEAAAVMNKMELVEGRVPQTGDECALSQGMLKLFGIEAGVGDEVTLPFQAAEGNGYGLVEKRNFTISGILPTVEGNESGKMYTTLVSREFADEIIPKTESCWRVYFQTAELGSLGTTDDVENIGYQIAEDFGIERDRVRFNDEYLIANYVDPAIVMAVVLIMLVVMAAGMITIYSVYYISMASGIREFGKLKAMGATKKQLRQIVLREGMCVAAMAVPAGLILGSVILKLIGDKLYSVAAKPDDLLVQVITQIIVDDEISVFEPIIYVLAAAAALFTVYLSLRKPMRIAGRITPIEAVRYQEGRHRREGKGYESLNLSRLSRRNLFLNRRRTLLTITSMAATGILVMTLASLLSCMDSTDAADDVVLGEYRLEIESAEENREHPEYSWLRIQENNPLDGKLLDTINALPGVERTDVFQSADFKSPVFNENTWRAGITGVPEQYADMLENGIIEGHVTYEELKSGDQVVVDKMLRHWFPELRVGQVIDAEICDGGHTRKHQFTIAAFGEYPYGLCNSAYLIMASEGVEKLWENNQNYYIQIQADKSYDSTLHNELTALIGENTDVLSVKLWKDEYEMMERSYFLMRITCYTFLAILAAISIMNLINTMVSSVQARRKEIGILQALGMSDRQSVRMLQTEGLFYTAGTLFLSLSAGCLAGYGLFLYCRNRSLMGITNYHFPWEAAVIVILVVLVVQLILGAVLGKSVRRETITDRIRVG